MKKAKSFLTLMCAFCLIINNIAFAATSPQNSKMDFLVEECSEATVYNQQHENNLRALMDMYGFTEEEQMLLLQIEEERLSAPGISLYAFPSNPKVGDVYEARYRIGINTLIAGGTSAAQIAAAIAGATSLPVAICITLAAGIAADYANDKNIKGIILTVEYTYGPTNDGPLGWTPGYMSYETY